MLRRRQRTRLQPLPQRRKGVGGVVFRQRDKEIGDQRRLCRWLRRRPLGCPHRLRLPEGKLLPILDAAQLQCVEFSHDVRGVRPLHAALLGWVGASGKVSSRSRLAYSWMPLVMLFHEAVL